ncbi:NK-tumor recognition protein-like isoform X4 [Schistocerca gregaria]|uniref:NK-tumor recognition protein-like isoform X3 n=1 Tax=Schistocerca gregaria TaxID=7010 RepID=UPI00211E80CF|nr:NK-tumor recognition protein-like isoform X3 [Schistocerca gregaria]XP_049842904.1 NK-tumor recognition protein-like isoform X4 [Schistocerca gregaria]
MVWSPRLTVQTQPETMSEEESGSSDKENNNMCTLKDRSHLNWKKHKHKESEMTYVAQSEHEFACPTCLKTFSDHSSFITHLLFHSKEKIFSCEVREKSITSKQGLQSQRNHDHKDHLASKAAVVCGLVSEVNGRSNNWSQEIPETTNEEESGSSNKENKNMCTQKDKSHQNRKKRKHKDTETIHLAQSEHEFACPTCLKTFSDHSSFVTHLLFHREEKLFSCAVHEKSITSTQSLQSEGKHHRKDNLASKAAIVCSMETKVNSRSSSWSHETTETTNREESGSSNGESKNTCTQKDRQHLNQKRNKNKESQTMCLAQPENEFACPTCLKTFSDHSNFVTHLLAHREEKIFSSAEQSRRKHHHKDHLPLNAARTYSMESEFYSRSNRWLNEIPGTTNTNGEESENADHLYSLKGVENKNIKHKYKDTKVIIASTMASHETVTGNREELGSSNNEKNILHSQKDNLHLKGKKYKHKETEVNIGDSVAPLEVPVTSNKDKPVSSNEENKYLCAKKDSSHPRQNKNKHKEGKVNTGDSEMAYEITVTANEEESGSSNEVSKNLCTKEDSSHLKQKKHEHKDTEVSTGDNVVAYEIPVTAYGEESGSSNEESKNRCRKKSSSHTKRKKRKHKETEVNTEDNVVSYEIAVTANRDEPESSKEENKNLCAKEDSSHPKRKKHKHKEARVNNGDSMVSCEIPVTSSGEGPERNNKENEKKKGKSHSKCKKHKHRETVVNTGDSMAAREIPVTADGAEPGNSKEANKNLCIKKYSSHSKQKKYKQKETEVNNGDNVVSYEIPVTANGEELGSSNEESKNRCTNKGSSHMKRKKHKHKEIEVNTEDSVVSYETPVTTNREEPKSSKEGNKNLCAEEDSSPPKRKKHKHKEAKDNNGDSMVSYEIPVTSSGEDPERNNKENEKKKGKSHSKCKKHKHRETEVNTADSMAAREIPVTADGAEPGSSKEANKNLCIKKYSSHSKQKKYKQKETEVNNGDNVVSYEIPVTANGEELGSSNEESKNRCTNKGSSHMKRKKHKHKEIEVNTEDSVVSYETPVTANREEPESSKEGNKNLCAEEDSSPPKRKKHKHKEAKDNNGDSMVSCEIPVTSSGEDPERNSKENEKKKGKSHSKCKKHKHRETEVNTGDSMAAREIPVTADGEEPESSKEGNKNLCAKKDGSHLKRKKHKHKEDKSNTGESIASYEMPVTSNGEDPESNNKENERKKDKSHSKWKKHKRRETEVNTGHRVVSCEMPVTSSGEDPEGNNKENEKKKGKSHLKRKRRKHKETEVNTGDSVVSCEMPVTSSGEDPEGNNKENEKKKGKSHLKWKRHKHPKETEVNIGDRMAAHEIPVTANGEEPESSNDENKNLCTKKDSSHLKQEKKKYKETKVNTGNSILSYEIPVTCNGEQTDNNNEESKNLRAKRGNLYPKQKKQKHGETGASIGDSMESHKMPVIVDGEEPESSNDENKNLCTKKDSSHEKLKKKKHKDTEVITGHSIISYKILAAADGEAPESSNEENKNLCTKKYSSKLKQKKNKHKKNKVNTGNNMVLYEIPVSANGEEEKGCNEENKNLRVEKHSSHAKLKKHKPKETEVNIGGSMASHKIPVTASGEEPESGNEENKNMHTKKHSSQLKQKKNKCKEGKINNGNSMVLYEIPMSASREESESIHEERKNMCSKQDSSHSEWKKHKQTEAEVDAGDSIVSYEVPVTSNGEKIENGNEESKNECTKTDSSYLKWKKHKHKETDVNIGDSIASHTMASREIPVNADGRESESSNEKNKSLCTKKDSSHLKSKKNKHKDTEVNTVDSMASHVISVTSIGKELESTNIESKNLCTTKDISHPKQKKHKHTETDVNVGDRIALHEIPVTSCGGEPESSNEENKNLCPQKDSSHPKQKKSKQKETEVNVGDSMMSSEIPVTANGEEPESSNEVNKNQCTQKDSFQWQHKEHNDKEGKIDTGDSVTSYELPVTSNGVEQESNNEESKIIYLARSLQKSSFITQSEQEFACPKCLKHFNNRSNFVRHLLVHRKEKDYSCAVCEKSFTLKQSLQLHMLCHMKEKQHICAVCSRPFTDANNLRRHRLIHSKIKEFVCDICSKAFSRKQQLGAHILRHKDAQSFSCPHCSKTFNYEYRLRIHLRACKKLNPFICPICSKQFPRVYNFNRHMGTHD